MRRLAKDEGTSRGKCYRRRIWAMALSIRLPLKRDDCKCHCIGFLNLLLTIYHKLSGLKRHKFIVLQFFKIRNLTWFSLGWNLGVSRAAFPSREALHFCLFWFLGTSRVPLPTFEASNGELSPPQPDLLFCQQTSPHLSLLPPSFASKDLCGSIGPTGNSERGPLSRALT